MQQLAFFFTETEMTWFDETQYCIITNQRTAGYLCITIKHGSKDILVLRTMLLFETCETVHVDPTLIFSTNLSIIAGHIDSY